MMKSLTWFVYEKTKSFHIYEKKGNELSGTVDFVHIRNHQDNMHLNPMDQKRLHFQSLNTLNFEFSSSNYSVSEFIEATI